LVIVVPQALADERIRQSGDDGRRWLAALPDLVERLCDSWAVEPIGESARHGANALVLPVRRRSEQCMLKVSWHQQTVVDEARALRAWGGDDAVLLLAALPREGALLLERLDDSCTLQALDLMAAAAVAGAMIRRLAIPAPSEMPRLGMVAAEVAETLQPRQAALGSPLPQRWLDLAVHLERDLAADAGEALVHGDLHYGNVLGGTRQPWLAIDPRALAGDPELSVPELIWTRIDEAADSRDVRTLLDVIVEAGGLDPEKAHAWTVVRAVDYWLWGLENGLTEDPIRCHRLLDILA
jgi:streptomycin 6-kinase